MRTQRDPSVSFSLPYALPHRSTRTFVAASAVALLLAACVKPDGKAAGGAPPQMPPPEVGVVTAVPGDVGLVTELPGRVEASRVAQVRARAAGAAGR